MLRANLAHAGGLRIDHVMGLQRLWVLPEGADPRHGAYLNYPAKTCCACSAWKPPATAR